MFKFLVLYSSDEEEEEMDAEAEGENAQEGDAAWGESDGGEDGEDEGKRPINYQVSGLSNEEPQIPGWPYFNLWTQDLKGNLEIHFTVHFLQISKNKGLTAKRKKENRNPRGEAQAEVPEGAHPPQGTGAYTVKPCSHFFSCTSAKAERSLSSLSCVCVCM